MTLHFAEKCHVTSHHENIIFHSAFHEQTQQYELIKRKQTRTPEL